MDTGFCGEFSRSIGVSLVHASDIIAGLKPFSKYHFVANRFTLCNGNFTELEWRG